MNWRQSPYAQIAQVLLRSVNPQDARWLFLVMACFVGLVVVSAGISTQWELAAVIKAIIGTIGFCLQFAGVAAFTVLMRLNHSVVSQLVPGYVVALRRSALVVWLLVCLLTGLAGMLDDGLYSQIFVYAFMAGAFMLLISIPLRWPVRWCLFMVGLVWFLKQSAELFESGPLHALTMSRAVLTTFVTLVFAGMAWLVTRLIAEKGSPYAALFSRFLGAQNAERISDKPEALVFNKFSLWHKAYVHAAQWTKLPWSLYAGHVLASPKTGPRNALARAELGFGAVVHWVTQASFSLAFAMLLALVWWSKPHLLLVDGASMSAITVFYIAMASVACASTSVLSIGDVMLRTQGEQKLMLLLPAVPRGNALSRMLAKRHLRQVFAAWAMATAWALVLPYPESVAIYVAAFCWGTLPLVPYALGDWAAARAPQADQAMLTLALTLLGPVSAWAILRWFHLPVELLAAVAVSSSLLILRIRWRQVAHYAQPLPVGRLA